MTKRRSIIAAFLLIAVLIMGIGYAQLTDQLNIQGSADINAFDSDVKFTAVKELKLDAGQVVDLEVGDASKFKTLSFNDDNGTMDIATDAIMVVGDVAIARYTICNNANYPVLVAANITKDDTRFFEIKTDWSTTNENPTGTKTIAAGSTIDITVTVKAVDMPTANDASVSFSIAIKAVGNPNGDATITW